jgi:hypothetical protein
LILAVPLVLCACEGFSEPISVDVKNDLHQTIAFAACTSKDCSHTQDRWVLKPGEAGQGGMEARAGYNSYIVIGPNHRVLGCLPFRMNGRPEQRVVALVSQALPCGSDGGARAAQNKDWPDPSL